jgi:signal transduction histidine kinase
MPDRAMRLTEFIESHRKRIIQEWVEFARTLRPWSTGLSDKELQDHAGEMLAAVVADMKTSQTDLQQSEKSKGHAKEGLLGIVGQQHASERVEGGLTLMQLVSEYRALRASVLRLWEKEQGDTQNEISRFNEAIDETLGECAVRYSDLLKGTRDQFLDILGHDLRNPLGAITMGATVLRESPSSDERQTRVVTRILNSADRMNRMVGDLLDLTRTRLGTGIPITPKPMDLDPVCHQVVAELEAVHPTCKLRFRSKGNLRGEWDADRLHQVISNLVANAVQYGCKEGPVSVDAHSQGREVVLAVHNRGAPIPDKAKKSIFEPMVRHHHGNGGNPAGLGLGLHIASEIVTAHGGTIGVTSTAKKGTTFTVRLPRRPRGKTKRRSRS